MRATEVNKGTYRGDKNSNGQWRYFTLYCPECKAHDGRTHEIGCTGKFIEISSTARIPRKTASNKQWKLFNKKFCK